MIQVIGGKRYDTAKATLVYSWWNGHNSTDFKYRHKRLYRTASGAWFIHHEGGAMTDMAQSRGRQTTGGESIEPVSNEDAYGFLESHSDEAKAVAAIEAHFADRVQDA
jgi:hypothetical protein